MRPLKVGVVGGRGVGAAHVAALRTLPGVEVLAVAASSEASARRAAKALSIDRAVAGHTDLLAISDIDVVHVCTPNDSHAEITAAALDQGKHVLCEKPLASTPQEGQTLLDRADSTEQVAVLGYSYRYLSLVSRLRELIVAGTLGEIHSARGTYLQNWMLPPRPETWRTDPTRNGASRVLADIGTHLMDLTEFVTGETIIAAAADFTSLTSADAHGHDDQASLLLRLSNGAAATMCLSQVSAAHTNHLGLAIDGELGSAIWTFDGREHLQLIEAGSSAQIEVDSHVGSAMSGRFWTSNQPGDSALRHLISAVYTEIRAIGGEVVAPIRPHLGVPLPGFAEGLRHLQAIEACSNPPSRSQLTSVPISTVGPETEALAQQSTPSGARSTR